MKFWITCRRSGDFIYYGIHAEKPTLKKFYQSGVAWHSDMQMSVCNGMLKVFFGEDYDLPKVGECWEFSVKDDIWIHTK